MRKLGALIWKLLGGPEKVECARAQERALWSVRVKELSVRFSAVQRHGYLGNAYGNLASELQSIYEELGRA